MQQTQRVRLLTAVNCDKLVTVRPRKIPLADRLFFSLADANGAPLVCALPLVILAVVTEIALHKNLFYEFLNADVLSRDVAPNTRRVGKGRVSPSCRGYLQCSKWCEWQQWMKTWQSTELQRWVWFSEYSIYTTKTKGAERRVWCLNSVWRWWCRKCLVFSWAAQKAVYDARVLTASWCFLLLQNY